MEQCAFQKERVMHLVMTSRQVSISLGLDVHVKKHFCSSSQVDIGFVNAGMIEQFLKQ